MRVEVAAVRPLRFADGRPVRGASAVAAYGDGWLVAQDDASHAAWLRGDQVSEVRLLPAVDGRDVFSEESGTKHLKPDLEAAVVLGDSVLLLGSGSRPARMRAVLLGSSGVEPVVTDLAGLYARVATALDVRPEELNLEGACAVEGAVRWFQRGLPARGLATASVRVDLPGLLAACQGEDVPAARIGLDDPHTYALRSAEHDNLAITDAVALPDGRVLVSAAEEDSPNVYDDGKVLGSALALLDGDTVRAVASIPPVDGTVAKVEGLALVSWSGAGGRLLAVVDGDDPGAPAGLLTLEVTL